MTAHSRRAFRPILNRLDDRCLLSGLTPAQMCHAYGVDSFHFVSHGQSIKADGSGQTIAIVDAYHDPYIIQDLKTFDCKFGLSDPQMTVYGVNGTSSDDGWAEEECLDVEWAHAIAPGAKIIVVEAASQSTPDLIHAVGFARNQPDVVAVSMSFRINNQFEFSAETQLDGYFTTPSGHKGITFLASTGDSGARDGAQYPAASPNVLAVGGTTLSVDQDGNYLGETGWSEGGGGPSAYEPEPSYQYYVQNSGYRTTPDVAMDADPDTGCMVSYTVPSTGQWSCLPVGGTSASTPMWAGLIAIADQGRAVIGKGSLDGPTQTLPAIYSSQMDGDFHDIISGYNGYDAGPGYDLVTGRGSPIAFNVVRDLMQVGDSDVSSYQVAASSTARGANLAGGPMMAYAFDTAPSTPSSPLPSDPMRTPRAAPAPVIVAPEIAIPRLTVLTQVPDKARAALHHDLALDALQQYDFDFDLSWVA